MKYKAKGLQGTWTIDKEGMITQIPWDAFGDEPSQEKVSFQLWQKVTIGLTLLFIIMLIALPASATNRTPEQEQKQKMHQFQKQSQDQDQNQSVTVGTTNSAVNDQSVTITEEHPDDIKIRNVPAVYAPVVTATAPCLASSSGGLSVAGFGGSLGKTKIDPECTLRETSRQFWNYGEYEAALELLCASEVSKTVLGDRCPDSPTQREITYTKQEYEAVLKEHSRRCNDTVKECAGK